MSDESEYPKRNLILEAVANSFMAVCVAVLAISWFVLFVIGIVIIWILEAIAKMFGATIALPCYLALVLSRLLQGRWKDALYTNVEVSIKVVR